MYYVQIGPQVTDKLCKLETWNMSKYPLCLVVFELKLPGLYIEASMPVHSLSGTYPHLCKLDGVIFQSSILGAIEIRARIFPRPSDSYRSRFANIVGRRRRLHARLHQGANQSLHPGSIFFIRSLRTRNDKKLLQGIIKIDCRSVFGRDTCHCRLHREGGTSKNRD